MQKILCLSYFHAKPPHREELISALLQLVEPTRAETGCLQYELFVDREDPQLLIMAEQFATQQALDDHEKKPYIVRFVEGPMMSYCEKVTWHVAQAVHRT